MQYLIITCLFELPRLDMAGTDINIKRYHKLNALVYIFQALVIQKRNDLRTR